MARDNTSKAALIRWVFETQGIDTRPKDVIATLAKRRVQVASAQVSAIKAKLKSGNTVVRQSMQRNHAVVSLNDLLAAKRYVEALGTIAEAKAALDALASILR